MQATATNWRQLPLTTWVRGTGRRLRHGRWQHSSMGEALKQPEDEAIDNIRDEAERLQAREQRRRDEPAAPLAYPKPCPAALALALYAHFETVFGVNEPRCLEAVSYRLKLPIPRVETLLRDEALEAF